MTQNKKQCTDLSQRKRHKGEMLCLGETVSFASMLQSTHSLTFDEHTTAMRRQWEITQAFLVGHVLSICFAPTSSAAPCSVSVQRLLLCFGFLHTASATNWVFLRRFTWSLAKTLSAEPHLEVKLFSFRCSSAFTSTSSTRRIQTPFADPMTLILLSLRHLLLCLWSERHRSFARQVTPLTLGKLTFLTNPFGEVFV